MIGRAALLLLALTAARDDPLAGRVAGAPVDCIDLSRVQGPAIIDTNTIIYTQNGRRLWKTGPVGECGQIRSFDTLVVDVYGNQICRNDRFRVRSQNSPILGPYCRFQAFVPYDKVK